MNKWKQQQLILIYEILNHSTSCPYFLFVTEIFYLSHYKYIYFQNFLIVYFMHNLVSSSTKDAKRKQYFTDKSNTEGWKADDLVLFNDKICTSVCISYILVHTKYELQITGSSGGKIISFNDEPWLNDTTPHRLPTWQACWTVSLSSDYNLIIVLTFRGRYSDCVIIYVWQSQKLCCCGSLLWIKSQAQLHCFK
jgi:hypothetical protein